MYFSPKLEEIVSLQKYQDEWSLDYDTSRDYEKSEKYHVAPPNGLLMYR